MKKKNPEKWHGAHHYSDKLHLFFIFFLFLSLGTFIYFYLQANDERLNYRAKDTISIPSPTSVACTEEAKLCPDGTVVFRSGPKCEFTKCPAKEGGEL